MTKKRKFRKGEMIITLSELAEAIVRGEWIYLGEVPKHYRILENMTLFTLRCYLGRGMLFHAIREDEQ